uniref:Uncharacterized protein n=1 Tax=Oryza rufipogon TaxID=4529 RepID=A0A0E0PD59_ORYRU
MECCQGRFCTKKSVALAEDQLLSEVSHRNIARAVGFCPNSSNPVHEHFAVGTLELLTGLRHQHPFDSVAPKLREGRLHEVIDPTLLTGKQLPAPNEEVRKMFELAVMYMLSAQNGLCMLGVAKELMQIVRNNIGSSSKIEISLEETFLELEPAADDLHVAQDAASPSSLKRELTAELHHHLIHLE